MGEDVPDRVPTDEELQDLAALMERYPRLFDSAAGVAFVTDPAGLLTWTSPAIEHVLGYRAGSVLGRSLASFLHPDDAYEAGELGTLLSAAAPPHSDTGDQARPLRVARADGTFLWCTVSAARSVDGQGLFAGLVGDLQDVDALVTARERADRAHARLRRVIDAQIEPHVTLIAIRDAYGNVVDLQFEEVNEPAARFHRRSVEALIGASTVDLIGPEAAAGDLRAAAEVLASGEAKVWNDVWSHVREFQGAPPTWLDIRIVPVDEERVSYYWRDVSDRHLAQQRLAESEQQFRLLAETSSEVSYLTGPDRRVRYVAPTITAVLGWLPEDWIGAEAFDFVHPDDQAALISNREAAYAGRPVPNPEIARAHLARLRARDGTYRWMSLSNDVVRDVHGTVLGRAGSMRDVNDLVVARDDAARAHDLLRRVIDSQVDPQVLFRAMRAEDGTITDFLYEDANWAAAIFEKRSRDELVGRTLREVAPSAEEGENDATDCARVLETGVAGVWNDEPTFAYLDDRGRRIILDIRIVRIDEERVSYSWRDVTDRHEARHKMEQSEERFRLLAETMSDVVSLSRGGVLEWVSPSVTRAFGWDPEELVGLDPFALVHPDDLADLSSWRPGEGSGLHRRRYRLRRKDGGYHWVESEGRLIAALGSGTEELMLSSRIVDAEVAALTALESRARHDALTGLVNRTEVFDQVDLMLTGHTRTGDRLAIAFCDLDGFKQVNDSYGHNAGDVLLHTIAERLQDSVRAGDVVGRLGGDELLVVLNGVRDLDDAIRIADKLRERIGEEAEVPGGRVFVSASVGVTLAEPGETVDDIVARADAAMYEAKRRGKDAVFAIRGPGA